MSDNNGWRPALPEPRGGGPQSQATPVRPMIGGSPPPAAHFDDPVGMQSVLTRGPRPKPFRRPEIEEERVRAKFPVKGLLMGLAFLLAVGITVGVVYVTVIRKPVSDPNVSVKATATVSEQAQAATPQETVQAYFDALIAGDIQRALSLGDTGGTGQPTLITPDAFARTRELAPITNFEIHTDDPTATDVEVSYDLEGKRETTSVKLIRLETGNYQMARTTVSVQLQLLGGQNLPVFVNGQRVDPEVPLEVVPGRYELSTGLPYISFPETNNLTIRSLAYTDTTIVAVSPQLTDEGRDQLMQAARRSLTDCLATKEVQPVGCPFGIRVNRAFNRDTVVWTLRDDPWKGVTPRSAPMTRPSRSWP